ncbi:MAG: hypothetical protein OEO79_05965 [Gemmatimonadota bacterium]|nr:hypothetical protein [Gemmatimonadota bacterium]
MLIALYGLPTGAVDLIPDDRSLVVYSVRVADTLRIAVFGEITSGPLIRLVPLDASAAPLIGIRVEDAASRANEQRESVSGYGLELQLRQVSDLTRP